MHFLPYNCFSHLLKSFQGLKQTTRDSRILVTRYSQTFEYRVSGEDRLAIEGLSSSQYTLVSRTKRDK